MTDGDAPKNGGTGVNDDVVLHDQDRLELAIIENVQRANLNPLEAARAYAKLQDQFNLTQREIATRIGKSRETIANTIRLLNLPSDMQDAIINGSMSESQARLLLSVEDPARQQQIFNTLIRDNLSVRQLRSHIQMAKAGNLPTAEATQESHQPSPEIMNLQRAMEEFLGTKVKLETSGQTGKITIPFYSPEELEGIVHKLAQPQSEESEITQPTSLEDTEEPPAFPGY